MIVINKLYKGNIMGIKFSSVVFLILAVFIVKISLENFGEAKAGENKSSNKIEKIDINDSNFKLSQK